MTACLPMGQFFYALRQKGLSLGLRDYLIVLDAIYAGKCSTRNELVLICETLWGTSNEECIVIGETIKTLMPEEFTLQELELMDLEHNRLVGDSKISSDEDLEGDPITPLPQTATESNELQEQLKDQSSKTSSTTLEEQVRVADDDATHDVEKELQLFYGKTYSDVRSIEAMGEASTSYSAITFGGQLPVSQRQIDQAWRHYRQSRRIGPKTQLDIRSTIEEISNTGLLLKPTLIAKQMNVSRLLLLVDVGGSMTPFKRSVKALLHSARQNNMAEVNVFYFHDVPRQNLYTSEILIDQNAVSVQKAILSAGNAGVLIISDGGSARGNVDEIRAEQTEAFIRELRHSIQYIAWLNPMPLDRWSISTAGLIVEQTGISMFYYDRAGLEKAIALVRGATRVHL